MQPNGEHSTVNSDLLSLRYVPLGQVLHWERNPKKHDEVGIQESLERHGFLDPPKFEPALNGGRGGFIEGNGRTHVLEKMRNAELPAPRGIVAEGDAWLLPVIFGVDAESEAAAEAYGVTHNNLTMAGGDFSPADIQRMWDSQGYLNLLGDLAEANYLPVGFADDTLDALMSSVAGSTAAAMQPQTDLDEARRTLAERFGIPPFTILDARQGRWQERKKAWINLGVNSEEGRGVELAYQSGALPPEFYELRNRMRTNTGVDPKWDEVRAEGSRLGMLTPARQGTSIFDPVLCELVYRWFCPPGGIALDPFAGGCVRGIIAAKLGRNYHGVDLRPEQVEANEAAWHRFAPVADDGTLPRPCWTVGDSCDLPDMEQLPTECDFVFSCPPYADLEQYSDDERDLSNMNYDGFLRAYFHIIRSSVARLKEDRFACFVVGDVRDKRGNYRGFVADTMRAFEDAGARFYNDAILVTQVSSGAIRAGRAFASTRKLCKTHQNVLVFVKGDPKKATQAVGSCEWGELNLPEEETPSPHDS